MARTRKTTDPYEALAAAAKRELRMGVLQRGLIEGDDAKPEDRCAHYDALVVGTVDGEAIYVSMDSDGSIPSPIVDELRQTVPFLDSDPTAAFSEIAATLAATRIRTIAMLVRATNQRGEVAGLLYWHPNIDAKLAGGFLRCATEQDGTPPRASLPKVRT